MAKAGIRPPFGSTDTDKFLWAKSWADDPDYEVLKVPRLGCVVVLTRSGGGHVSTYESTSGNNYMLRGGNQSDAINVAAFPRSSVVALVWPKDAPPRRRSSLRQTPCRFCGKEVPARMWPICRHSAKMGGWRLRQHHRCLVNEFQRSQGLAVDGVVGEATWAALLDEEPPVKPPAPGGRLDPRHHGDLVWRIQRNRESAYPPYDKISATEISVALPYRFTGTLPMVEVMNDQGDVYQAKIRDVGPWMIDDNYWAKGTRPIAEQCYASKTPLPSGPQKGRVPSNPAGIDLSAALAEDLGIDGMGKVSWRLVL